MLKKPVVEVKVRAQQEMQSNGHDDSRPVIQMSGIVKTFETESGCVTTALNGLTMDIYKGQVRWMKNHPRLFLFQIQHSSFMVKVYRYLCVSCFK